MSIWGRLGKMVDIAQEYQRNVTLALQMARSAADQVVRRQWLSIADEWTELAKARMEAVELQAIKLGRAQKRTSA